jgi:23S rRNA (cytosine1962-C5)-methyltransferase
VTDDARVDEYELLDVGRGMRLERFGSRVVARPHAAASGERGDPDAWRAATLEFVSGSGWRGSGGDEPWQIHIEGLTFELRPTATGQVGLFPEQAPSWDWVRQRVAGGARQVLNLFGYTGVATLVAARAGAEVVHVDAARPSLAWARRNAELSGLADRPIRWLVDDAAAFVERELRRGRRYDGVVLDPPSYGHGRAGRTWRLEADLPGLLADCAELVDAPHGFVLLTAHTQGIWPAQLAGRLGDAIGVHPATLEAGQLSLQARSGRRLELGAFARWPGTA